MRSAGRGSRRPAPCRSSRERVRASAFALWRSMRTCSVSMPRSIRNALMRRERRRRYQSARRGRRNSGGLADDDPAARRSAADPLGQRSKTRSAPARRPAQPRRRERVVDRQRGAVSMGDLDQRRKVGDHDRWVGDRLDVEHPRVRLERGLDRGHVRRSTKVVSTPRRPAVLEQVLDAAVERARPRRGHPALSSETNVA